MRALLPFLIACSGKGSDSAGQTDTIVPLEAPPEGEGFQLSMTAEAPPYSEVWACEVYSLPTDEFAAVNWLEFQQNAGTHHMTISTTALSGVSLEPGPKDCEQLYAEQMSNIVSIFGNQGAAEGEMHLPDGIAANLPPAIDIIHEIHYVNPTDETIDLYSRINAWTIPQDEVVEGIWGGQVRDENIEIPANSEHTEWTRCVMNTDVEVLFLASHTHKLGIEFTIAPFDGKETGEVFYSNDDWHDPMIVQYEPAMVVPAGTGFEFTCTWRNDTDQPITYGSTAEDEMCNLAIVHTPFDMSAQCEVVETSDGVLWEG
jgi:hypothetical protein